MAFKDANLSKYEAIFERALTLIRAAGGVQYMTSETLKRYNSTTPEVTKKYEIIVFLKKRLRSIF
jgi:hypothetical protein